MQWPDRGHVNCRVKKPRQRRTVKTITNAQRPWAVGVAGTHLEVRARFLRAKVALVRPVAAVVLRVAFPRRRHAPAVVAKELRGRARHVRATRLVAIVAAVVLAVAPERAGHAPAGTALPLARGARRF